MSFSDLNECKKVNGEFKMRFEQIGLDNFKTLYLLVSIVVLPSSNNKNNTAKSNVGKNLKMI